MTENAFPSRDPANDDELAGLFNEVLHKFVQANLDDMLPARVVAYDKEANRVRVQPLIQVLTTNNERVTRAQIQSIPVFQLGGGGYGLFFNNLQEGDLGWIKASDRDISLFLTSYQEERPNSERLHKFEDAVFLPDVMRNYDIVDGEHVTLQSVDGARKVAITNEKVRIISDVDVELIATDEINLTSSSQVNINTGTANIGDQVNLGSGGNPIARAGDTVQVTITSGSSAGVWSGVITSGSANHTAD